MNFINLTPHDVHICASNDVVHVIPASGVIARCNEVTTYKGDVEGITFVYKQYGEVENLPEPEFDTIYIVSAMIRNALPNRTDIASPGDAIRDAGGKIIGCLNLVINR